MEPSGVSSFYYSPYRKRSRQQCLHKVIEEIFIVIPFAVQHSFPLRDCSPKLVANVRILRLQSIRIVYLMIVDLDLEVRKICCKMLFTRVIGGTRASFSSSCVSSASEFSFDFSVCSFLNSLVF